MKQLKPLCNKITTNMPVAEIMGKYRRIRLLCHGEKDANSTGLADGAFDVVVVHAIY